MRKRAFSLPSSTSRWRSLSFAALLAAAWLAACFPASATTYRYTQFDVPDAPALRLRMVLTMRAKSSAVGVQHGPFSRLPLF